MYLKEVADIEVYQDLYMYIGHDLDSDSQYEYIFSPYTSSFNDIMTFCTRMRNNVAMMGFNNKGYDQHVIHYILTNSSELSRLSVKDACMRIYLFSKQLIESDKKPWIKRNEVIVPHFDIFLLHHFNNKARRTSLKWIEFAMRMENIADLPYPPDQPLGNADKVEDVRVYCHHDVSATKQFIQKSDKEIKLRQQLSKTYGLDLYDAPDAKIGSEIILKYVSEKMGLPSWEVRKMRTYRNGGIDLSELILPTVQFKTEEFNGILEKFRNTVIRNTKGELDLTVNYRGIPYEYGTGGLHACIDSGSFFENETHMILDIDVTSYYPNLAIRNRMGPEHLGDAFPDVYEMIFETRKTFPKGTPENYGLKIALNGAFGKMNDVYSFLYDPKCLLFITVNGQLLLSMLAESILLGTNAELLQANTDGITVRVPRDQYEIVKFIMKEWEQMTSLQLEEAEYKSMFIRDVNNYLAVTTDDKYKFKGDFEIDKAWHKDHSMRIVPIAVARACVHGISPEETIKEHLNRSHYEDLMLDGEPCKAHGIYDLCGAARARGDAKYRLTGFRDGIQIDQDLPKTNRYYVSNVGLNLMKILPPNPNAKDRLLEHREKYPNQLDMFHFVEDPKEGKYRFSHVEAGNVVTLFNKAVKGPYDINVDYYVNECNKILDKL